MRCLPFGLFGSLGGEVSCEFCFFFRDAKHLCAFFECEALSPVAVDDCPLHVEFPFFFQACIMGGEFHNASGFRCASFCLSDCPCCVRLHGLFSCGVVRTGGEPMRFWVRRKQSDKREAILTERVFAVFDMPVVPELPQCFFNCCVVCSDAEFRRCDEKDFVKNQVAFLHRLHNCFERFRINFSHSRH